MRGEGREESGEGSGEKRRLESGERILRAECINICKIQERFRLVCGLKTLLALMPREKTVRSFHIH